MPTRVPTFALLLALAAAGARADTITVPGDFATLAEAVAAAQTGDTVSVGKDVPPDPVTINGWNSISLVAKKGATLSGLEIQNCTNVYISGLTIADAPDTGIYLNQCTDVTITKCTVLRSGSYGIRAEDSFRIGIVKNLVAGGLQAAIAFVGAGVDDGLISGNTTTDTTGAGLWVQGARTVIEKNRVTTDGSGITINSGATNNRVYGNTVVAGLVGIGTWGAGATIEKNRIAITGVAGIQIAADGCTVLGNSVAGTCTYGIRLVANVGQVEKNKVAAGQFGISVEGPGFSVRWNQVKGATEDGIRVETGGGRYEGNKVSKCLDDGFDFRVGSNDVIGNKASGNADFDLEDTNPGGEPNEYEENKFKRTNL